MSETMSDLAFLQGVRELLSVPGRWTQGRMARGASGEPRPWPSSEAVCWCLVGAGEKVLKTPSVDAERSHDKMARLLDLSEVDDSRDPLKYVGDRRPVLFNDAETTTHEMVLAKLDDAIARETARIEQATQADDNQPVVAPSES